jgi:hypothetical protein
MAPTYQLLHPVSAEAIQKSPVVRSAANTPGKGSLKIGGLRRRPAALGAFPCEVDAERFILPLVREIRELTPHFATLAIAL